MRSLVIPFLEHWLCDGQFYSVWRLVFGKFRYFPQSLTWCSAILLSMAKELLRKAHVSYKGTCPLWINSVMWVHQDALLPANQGKEISLWIVSHVINFQEINSINIIVFNYAARESQKFTLGDKMAFTYFLILWLLVTTNPNDLGTRNTSQGAPGEREDKHRTQPPAQQVFNSDESKSN